MELSPFAFVVCVIESSQCGFVSAEVCRGVRDIAIDVVRRHWLMAEV